MTILAHQIMIRRMRRMLWFLLWMMAGVFSFRGAEAQLNKAYFFYAGRSLLIEDKYQDAIEVLNILLRADTSATEGYFLRGIAKYNLEDLLGAEQDFTRAIRQNPVFTTAYQYRAITRSRLGNYDDALRDFQEAIDLRPDIPSPYYSRAVTYLLSQQFEKAVEDFSTFIKYDPKVSEAYLNRGTSYLYLKDTLRALSDYEQGIRTNYFDPNGYNRRGSLYLSLRRYEPALEDFNKALDYDSTFLPAYFNRALLYSRTQHPVDAIADFSKAVQLDSTNAITYFNRAILRTQIGDYNKALEDYNRVAILLPNNVLIYYNRAGLYTQLGNYEAAIADYSRAIDLYPDFANAYLGRSSLRYNLRDMKGSRSDKETADRKIAEYRAKLNDSTFSIYADTSRQFNQLLSFENTDLMKQERQAIGSQSGDLSLLPLFKFSLIQSDSATAKTQRPSLPDTYSKYYNEAAENFCQQVGWRQMQWVNRETNLPPDTLFVLDEGAEEAIRQGDNRWQAYFKRGVTQSLIRQYTSAIAQYTAAIDRNPSNPFLYINRSTTQSEMIDFISSIDNNFHRISVDSDPGNRLRDHSTRSYNYDDAIADLNKAIKLLPNFAYTYYNRANLYCLSGAMSEALEDYTHAIELNPTFAEAYFNRGLIQIFLKDTHKGCLDMSKAGELGIAAAYQALKLYGQPLNR
ncbi:MAG: tetratricopeptide repeat protein [Alistipes sp.]|nr:tetratricopeptide repeat protein [Alistipes sp.]